MRKIEFIQNTRLLTETVNRDKCSYMRFQNIVPYYIKNFEIRVEQYMSWHFIML
jgi:hypothetical protein